MSIKIGKEKDNMEHLTVLEYCKYIERKKRESLSSKERLDFRDSEEEQYE